MTAYGAPDNPLPPHQSLLVHNMRTYSTPNATLFAWEVSNVGHYDVTGYYLGVGRISASQSPLQNAGEEARTRIFVHYDKAGTIHALIGVDDAPSGVEVIRDPAPGMLVTEVEGVELDFRPECFAQLQQFIDGHTVEITQTSPARITAKE